jgi:class 3 adenylate cyclase
VTWATFEAAGLYDPDAPGAPARLALLEYLTGLGATVAQMVEADAHGLLHGLSAVLAAFPTVEQLTLFEVAERCGTSVELVQRMLLAQGIPVDETSLLPAFAVDDVDAFTMGAALFGEESTLAFTRVMGASVARVVDAAISLFYGEAGPTLPAGATELERARAGEGAGALFALIPSVMTHLLEMSFRRGGIVAALARGDNVGQVVSVGVGFVDLVGSTDWAEGSTLRDHALALGRFASAAWDIATAHDGRVAKLIGDEAMIVASSADAVCRICPELCVAAADDRELPDARGGVRFGRVVSRDGDYFGPLVNLVARSVKVAPVGCVVVTDGARRQLGRGAWRVTDIGEHQLRGIDTPVPLSMIAGGAVAAPGSARQ